MGEEYAKPSIRKQDHDTIKSLASEESRNFIEQVGKITTFYMEHKDAKEDPQVAELLERIANSDDMLQEARAEIQRLKDLKNTIIESKPEVILKTEAAKEIAQIQKETKQIEVQGRREVEAMKVGGNALCASMAAAAKEGKFFELYGDTVKDMNTRLMEVMGFGLAPPENRKELSAAKGQ